jgi:hypothetical protein
VKIGGESFYLFFCFHLMNFPLCALSDSAVDFVLPAKEAETAEKAKSRVFIRRMNPKKNSNRQVFSGSRDYIRELWIQQDKP